MYAYAKVTLMLQATFRVIYFESKDTLFVVGWIRIFLKRG